MPEFKSQNTSVPLPDELDKKIEAANEAITKATGAAAHLDEVIEKKKTDISLLEKDEASAREKAQKAQDELVTISEQLQEKKTEIATANSTLSSVNADIAIARDTLAETQKQEAELTVSLKARADAAEKREEENTLQSKILEEREKKLDERAKKLADAANRLAGVK